MSVAEYVGGTALTKDGQISKMEFRKSVRTLLPQTGAANNSEVDAMFESLDADKGGTLDVPELKAAFQKCKDEATERSKGSTKAREKAERLRKHAATTAKAIEATELAEQAEAELRERIEHPDVEARLGMLMRKRGVSSTGPEPWSTTVHALRALPDSRPTFVSLVRKVKIGDMVAKWDKVRLPEVELDRIRPSRPAMSLLRSRVRSFVRAGPRWKPRQEGVCPQRDRARA